MNLASGEILIDSWAILDYLDESQVRRGRLTPSHGPERRKVLQAVALAAGTAEKAGAVTYERYFHPRKMLSKEWEERCLDQLKAGLTQLEKNCGTPWYSDLHMSQADVTIGCMIGYVKLRVPEAFPPKKFPKLHAPVAPLRNARGVREVAHLRPMRSCRSEKIAWTPKPLWISGCWRGLSGGSPRMPPLMAHSPCVSVTACGRPGLAPSIIGAKQPEGALGLVILLDQVSRNIHRGSPLAFAGDAKALALAKTSVGRGYHQKLVPPLALWLIMPFEHAEDLDAQHRGVALFGTMGLHEMVYYAQMHLDIIARFGRFPHRNPVLGRRSTAAEIAFLQAGGFAG